MQGGGSEALGCSSEGLNVLSSHLAGHAPVEDRHGLFSRSATPNSTAGSAWSDSDWSDHHSATRAGGRPSMADAATLDDIAIEICRSPSGFQRFDKVESCNDIARLDKAESCNDIAALAALAAQAGASPVAEQAAEIALLDAGYRRYSTAESCNELAAEPAAPAAQQAAGVALLDAGYRRFSKLEGCNQLAALEGPASQAPAPAVGGISRMDARFQRFGRAESCNQCVC